MRKLTKERLKRVGSLNSVQDVEEVGLEAGDSVVIDGGADDDDDEADDVETYDSDVYTDDEGLEGEEKQRMRHQNQMTFPRLTRKEKHFLIYLRK